MPCLPVTCFCVDQQLTLHPWQHCTGGRVCPVAQWTAFVYNAHMLLCGWRMPAEGRVQCACLNHAWHVGWQAGSPWGRNGTQVLHHVKAAVPGCQQPGVVVGGSRTWRPFVHLQGPGSNSCYCSTQHSGVASAYAVHVLAGSHRKHPATRTLAVWLSKDRRVLQHLPCCSSCTCCAVHAAAGGYHHGIVPVVCKGDETRVGLWRGVVTGGCKLYQTGHDQPYNGHPAHLAITSRVACCGTHHTVWAAAWDSSCTCCHSAPAATLLLRSVQGPACKHMLLTVRVLLTVQMAAPFHSPYSGAWRAASHGRSQGCVPPGGLSWCKATLGPIHWSRVAQPWQAAGLVSWPAAVWQQFCTLGLWVQLSHICLPRGVHEHLG
jgi:hypothetical protein